MGKTLNSETRHLQFTKYVTIGKQFILIVPHFPEGKHNICEDYIERRDMFDAGFGPVFAVCTFWPLFFPF